MGWMRERGREREKEREREQNTALHAHVTNMEQHTSPYATREPRLHCSGRSPKAVISL